MVYLMHLKDTECAFLLIKEANGLKKFLLISSVTLLLGACTSETSSRSKTEEVAEQSEEIVVDTNADEESSNIINDTLTTTFKPVVLEVPQLTEEEKKLHYELNERIATEIKPQTTDREFMASIADDYPGYSPEELGEFWYKGADASMYGGYGDTVIRGIDWFALNEEVVRVNMNDPNAFMLYTDSKWHPDFTESDFQGTFEVDGEEHEIEIFLEFSEDYRTAELTSLVVDGEDII